MKKLSLLSLLIITAFSCKKNRNCSCTTTIFYSGGQGYYSSETKPMTEKMTETQAKAVCDHEAENITATYYNFDTNSGNYSSTNTFHTDCILQ
ncbi:hypothetical protein [Aurantibacillus circumpalustris]|uniref:hypothetical protein n=1 Tax=Aurantibacillus circumpalustris TaxID=3036359 RepID=UPI00295BFB40|nr:hypothetical protein [Aurantibacillus circumpalustris]